MLTVQAALDTGLPVYIACRKCHAPSRQLDLQALVGAGKVDLDLDAFAKRGGFRCASCGSAGGSVMPTMDLVLRNRVRWQERCLSCGRERYMTAALAVETYGLATPLDLVRSQVKARCNEARCAMNSGPISRHPTLPPVPYVRKPRREPEWPHG